MQQPIVRAVDVGYGHVKWTDGYDGEAILAEAFPSQSVVSQTAQHQSAVWQQRDTFLIGGGATMYRDAIQDKFPHHPIHILHEPTLANVRGFHVFGESMAASAARATQGATA